MESEGLALIASIIAGAAFVGSGIWFLILAYQEGVAWALGCLLIPFLGWIYALLDWGRIWKPFVINIIALVALILLNQTLVGEMYAKIFDSTDKIETRIASAADAPPPTEPQRILEGESPETPPTGTERSEGVPERISEPAFSVQPDTTAVSEPPETLDQETDSNRPSSNSLRLSDVTEAAPPSNDAPFADSIEYDADNSPVPKPIVIEIDGGNQQKRDELSRYRHLNTAQLKIKLPELIDANMVVCTNSGQYRSGKLETVTDLVIVLRQKLPGGTFDQPVLKYRIAEIILANKFGVTPTSPRTCAKWAPDPEPEVVGAP